MPRQPLILGYVLGGILISPLTPGPAVSDLHTFELFAEIGVILLMFSIGIEFSLRDLLRVKWVALLGGPLGILLSVGLGLGVAAVLGWPLLQGAIVGIVISVASTMVLARLLMDRGELHSRHGRIMIGITLVEDLAVVILIVLIPALGTLEPGRLLTIATRPGQVAADPDPGHLRGGQGRPAADDTGWPGMHSDEMFLLVALAVGLGTAALTQAAGLSLALGAFLAGLIINGSDYAHETLARLLPLRDVFVALFFVTIGALIDPARSSSRLSRSSPSWWRSSWSASWCCGPCVVWLFRQPFWTAALVGVGLTQIGEFSFILVQVARNAGHVGAEIYNATLAASLVTILINAVLVRTVPGWIARLRGVEERRRPDAGIEPGGDRARRALRLRPGRQRGGRGARDASASGSSSSSGIRTSCGASARAAVPCLFGDAAQPRLLEEAGAERASLVVVALPEMDRAQLVVRGVRAPEPGRAHPGARAQRRGARRAGRLGRHRGHPAGAGGGGHPDPPRPPRARAAAARACSTTSTRFRRAMSPPGADAGRRARTAEALPEVHEVTLGAGALADLSLGEARVRERFGVTVVSVERPGGDAVLNPSADTHLRPGDRLRVFGLPEQIAAFRREAGRAI